ncbi:MAG TPA: endonuclease/exonuclease/phosphatase family protein [Acidimicrobiales bacterium]|nr:endonuclease/exonuclease/phosphatase family protein [Acidimicrobiales bacterium]
MPLRLVTFNVQHGRTADGATVDNRALAASCAGLGADILAVQEVDVGVRRSGRADQVGIIADACGLHAVFGRATRVGLRGRYGIALLSREPSTATTVHLPRVGRNEPRVAVVARLGPLTVVATHLSVRAEEVPAQLDAVLGLVPAAGPAVVAGDLNLGSDAVLAPATAAGFALADPSAPSFPARSPRARIDHVLVRGLPVGRVVVGPRAPVSDHLPVSVEIGT